MNPAVRWPVHVGSCDHTASIPVPTRFDWCWLVATLVTALALRVYRLDSSLWYDEVDTLVHYARLPMVELLTTFPSLNHHVFYSLQASAFIAIFGESAWALRMPALLFGLASIWALWLVCRQVVSPWETRLTVLLLAVSYHHVWFSQNARGYTGLLFWALIATYFLIRCARAPSVLLWTAYGVSGALACYTHLSAALLLTSQGVIAIGFIIHRLVRVRDAGETRPDSYPEFPGLLGLYGFALAGALAVLLHAPLLAQMVDVFTAVSRPAGVAEAASVAEWKSTLWMVLEVGRSLGPTLGVTLPVLAIIVGIGMMDLRTRSPILVATLMIHVPLTLLVLNVASMRVWPRYFFIDLGLICLFLVHGTFVLGRIASESLSRRLERTIDGNRVGLALSALGVVVSLLLLPANYTFPKQDFVGARDFVENNRSANSVVVTLGFATMPYADYYAPQWRSIQSIEELIAIRRSGRELWLVYSFPSVTKRRYKEITDYASVEFDAGRRFPGTLGGGDVMVFKSKPL